MQSTFNCKHCKPEEQARYLLPGPWKTLYLYYDHLGVDHGIIAKRHFIVDRTADGKMVATGEREDIEMATTRIAELKEALSEKRKKSRA